MRDRTKYTEYFTSEDMFKLWGLTRSPNAAIRTEANNMFTKAIDLPLRDAVLTGDVTSLIYQPIRNIGRDFKMPLSLIQPGMEGEYRAYSINGHGYIPQARVEASEVRIPTFKVANSIDWLLEHAEDAGPWFVDKAMEVYENGYVQKINDDGFAVILYAVMDRNLMVYDAAAPAGMFTKRVISMAKTAMTRNGGGNMASTNQSRLTDVFLSLEAMEDIRNWNVDQIDEITRREIYIAADGSGAVSSIFGVRLHPMVELGEGQKFQEFFLRNGGVLPAGTSELAIGLDLTPNKNTFIMPIKYDVRTFEDTVMHREQMQGYYGWGNWGFGNLDVRNIIGLAI